MHIQARQAPQTLLNKMGLGLGVEAVPAGRSRRIIRQYTFILRMKPKTKVVFAEFNSTSGLIKARSPINLGEAKRRAKKYKLEVL